MNPDRVAALGLFALLAFQYVRSDDSLTSFGIGGFVGLVCGFVLGAAWIAGERPPHIPDHIQPRTDK